MCASRTRPTSRRCCSARTGWRRGSPRGGLVIDCSTISPAATARIAGRLGSAGVGFVDAPVSGGSEGAKQATLTIFVGGEPADVERARPVLEAMGKTITHFGPAGSGQAVKAVNQVVIAGAYLGVAEGIVLALKAGLDPEAVAAALGGGAAPQLGAREPERTDDRQRVPARVPDLAPPQGPRRSPSSWPARSGATLPVAGLAAQLEAGLVARGHGDEDMSNLARAIRALSGLDG